MAELAARHPRLNVMNVEATATALLLRVEVWLSAPAGAGILPSVLDAEGVRWRTTALR